MMKLPIKLTLVALCTALICLINCCNRASSSKAQMLADTMVCADSDMFAYCSQKKELWIDTIMFADGHFFGWEGDVSMWGGWYFDTIYVGNDRILIYDSVAPATLRLSLVTKDLTVNLGDQAAAEKIKRFLGPIDGFKRFSKKFEEVIDSERSEISNNWINSDAYFDYVFDYVEDHPKSDMINQFVCRLACESGENEVDLTPLTSLYIGYNPKDRAKGVYKGKVGDMAAFCEYITNVAMTGWRSESEDLQYLSTALSIFVRAGVSCPNFVTFSCYRYDREGFSHGMYTETFHTLDLNTGSRLTNKDVFKDNSTDDVVRLLCETIAADPHYRRWNGNVDAKDIIAKIESWQSPDPIFDGTEFEEEKKDFVFTLPECALSTDGVIFSFQPYEIDCWAAGAFHFVVTYDKLKPYLTPRAKKLVNLN